eukprot:4141805-Pleurochrysis_carterae.AAC.4
MATAEVTITATTTAIAMVITFILLLKRDGNCDSHSNGVPTVMAMMLVLAMTGHYDMGGNSNCNGGCNGSWHGDRKIGRGGGCYADFNADAQQQQW